MGDYPGAAGDSSLAAFFVGNKGLLRFTVFVLGKGESMSWKVYVRKEREGECGPGLWISDERGNSVVDTGAIDCWPLSDEHKRMIEAVPDLLAALEFIVNDVPAPGENAELTTDGYNMACAAIAKAKGE